MSVAPLLQAAIAGPTAAVLPARALLARRGAWNALVAAAAEPNPHLSPRVVAAHLDHGLAGDDLRILLVEEGEMLLALLPFRLARGGLTAVGRIATPFSSPYVTSTLPLVAEGPSFARSVEVLAEGLSIASGGQPWRWPLLPSAGRVGKALSDALAARGWTSAFIGSGTRARLLRRVDLAAYRADRPDRDRARDLARRRRRLAALGALDVATATDGAPLAAAVETFLALEASGWKGARGTALASRPATAAFARALFAEGGDPVAVRADLLRLDGRAIAASLALVSGGVATMLKTAYDEAFARYAPGLLLEEEIVRALHETAFADALDSASRPGSVLESLYPDRERIDDLILAPPGIASREAAALARRARWRLAAGEKARDAVDGLRSLAGGSRRTG